MRFDGLDAQEENYGVYKQFVKDTVLSEFTKTSEKFFFRNPSDENYQQVLDALLKKKKEINKNFNCNDKLFARILWNDILLELRAQYIFDSITKGVDPWQFIDQQQYNEWSKNPTARST